MKTNQTKCSKCMYNAMFHMSSANNEDAPYVCKVCCGEEMTTVANITINEFEVASSSVNFVAAAC